MLPPELLRGWLALHNWADCHWQKHGNAIFESYYARSRAILCCRQQCAVWETIIGQYLAELVTHMGWRHFRGVDGCCLVCQTTGDPPEAPPHQQHGLPHSTSKDCRSFTHTMRVYPLPCTRGTESNIICCSTHRVICDDSPTRKAIPAMLIVIVRPNLLLMYEPAKHEIPSTST